MKRGVLFAATAAIAIALTGVASAQQAQPLPPLPENLGKLKFPMPAAQYDKIAQWVYTIIRQAPSRFHATQADADAVLLVAKECATQVEADGWVTKQESKYCERITSAKIHELMTPYIMQQQGGN